MAQTPRALTADELALVDRFAAGASVAAVAKAAQVPVMTVERLIRRAMGHAGQGSRQRG